MTSLALPSFRVRGYRGFSDLRIERLGRVNLIVGRNNVGKTSLLEAIQLYAERGNPPLIWQLLATRDETPQRATLLPYRDGIPQHVPVLRFADLDDLLASLRRLFYRRPAQTNGRRVIQLGPLGTESKRLEISLSEIPDASANRTGGGSEPLPLGAVTSMMPVLIIQFNSQPATYAIEATVPERFLRSGPLAIRNQFVSANGIQNGELGELWDSVALTGSERRVLDALRIIAPGVEGLSFIGDSHRISGERLPIVKMKGTDEPVALRSLGDGMQRVLGLSLALVNARGGILLVDEFENGLHYLVQPQVWKLVFQVAHQLDVQVFATSHSWDCIQAFQSVAQDDHESEGILLRLEVKKDDIAVTSFDEQELEIATREQIEVR